MQSLTKTVLLLGDQNDAFVEGIDYIYKQAGNQPWLRAFLTDSAFIIHEEMKHWDHALRETLGTFRSIQELSDKFRYTEDDVGMAHGLLIFIMRQTLLLHCMKREPALIGRTETISICGGLLNAAAVVVAKDFNTLYQASLELVRVFCEIVRIAYHRSRAIESATGSWGCAVTGISADELQAALEKFQRSMGIPEIKRVKIAVIGQGWSTIIGPPTVLNKVLQQCAAIRSLPKQELRIRALHHVLSLSDAELDELLGSSSLLDLPAGNVPWRYVVKSACEGILTRPFHIVDAVRDLDSRLGGAKHVDLNVIGASSHDKYIADQLKTLGRQVTVRHEHSMSLSLPRSVTENPAKIAIVGMAGRGPAADDLTDFWRIIVAGRDLHKRIPEDRFDINEFFSATHSEKCTTSAQFGCFIDRPGVFDARFFNISHREALLMEPCHRLWLMSVYEALEMAGYSRNRTRVVDPNHIGVFFGQSVDDWRGTTHHLGCDSYVLQGMQRAFGPGRVAHHFKWEGPTYSVDSACASSASAITLACQNLLSRECDMAVAGGANVMSSPHTFSALSRAGILSTTGGCKTYRNDADGYCRGEYAGAVILKRLEDAVEANDNILAVIAASGRNHSGNASSITTSDAGAQQRLFGQVLRNARVAPREISYVEMHGTGTQVGDLAEMTAVYNTFGRSSNDKNPLIVGALKANIGHCEAAAGIASLIKCVLCLQQELLPPVPNMPHKLNSHFPDLKAAKIEIPAESTEFKASVDRRRRMILNNFDASGGNTCLLIEDFSKVTEKAVDPRPCHVVTISAKSPASQTESKRRLLNLLRAAPNNYRIQDLAYTTNARRIHHPVRTAITASSIHEFIDKLDSDIKSNAKAEKVTPPPIVFMFTGQGSHYAGMGAQLYKTNHIFRDRIDLCVAICKQHGFSEFLDIITDPSADLSTKNTIETQLAVVTLEVALVSFWKSNGIEPAIVMGHSLGEYAALYAAGVLSLTDVLYLVGRRAQLVLDRCEPGACSMLSIVSSLDRVTEYVKKRRSCEVACINSPKAVVVSGTMEEIKALEEDLQKDGIRSQKLPVPYGFHSNQVDLVLDDYTTLARSVVYSTPKVPIASTLTSMVVEKQGVIDELYLVRQMREKVDYIGGLNAVLNKLKTPVFLEIGPSRVLGSFVRATLDSSSSDRIAWTLDGTDGAWSSISKALASLYSAGAEIDWTAFHQPYTENTTLIDLPTYCWDLKDYWLKWTEPRERPGTAAPLETKVSKIEKPISSTLHYVDTKSLSPKVRITFRSSAANPDLKALIKGHRLRTVPVCPGGVFCEMGLKAAKYTLEAKGDERRGLACLKPSFNRPFSMPTGESNADIITTITMPDNDTFSTTFSVQNGSTNYNIGQCLFKIVDKPALQSDWDKTSYFIKARADEIIKAAMYGEGHRFKPSVFYSLFSRTVEYDQAYKGVKEAYVSADFKEAAAEVVLQDTPSGSDSSAYWMDSLVHLAGFVANANPMRPLGSTLMMNGFEGNQQTSDVHVGAKYLSYVRVTSSDGGDLHCDVFVFDDADQLMMHCSDLHFHEVDDISLERALGKVNTTTHAAATSTTAKSTVSKSTSKATVSNKKDTHSSTNQSVLGTLLSSIATETGTDISELTDDAVLSELGVDSIMALQIVANVKQSTGFDVPSTLIFECPTVGHIRKEFASAQKSGDILVEDEVEKVMAKAASVPSGEKATASSGVLESILSAISAETGTGMDDITDDALLSELGCDSIMAIQIASTVNKETGYDLQGSFVLECPSIGDIRRMFENQESSSSGSTSPPEASSSSQEDTDVTDTEGSDLESKPVPKGLDQIPGKKRDVPSNANAENVLIKDLSVFRFQEENQEHIDFANIPKAKVILMQGKPASKETPLFLIPDGSGTAATYIHLPRFKSGLPIYAVESPFLRCPGKLSRKAGIPALAKLVMEAILKTRPEGPYIIGGFSGGATISYEVCRQFAAAGREVQGLLLIDMCCPREMTDEIDTIPEQGLALLMRLSPPDKRSFWTSSMATGSAQQHQRQIVRAVCHYNPPPLAPQDRPVRVCLIWARKGLIERAKTDSKVLTMMADMNIRTEMPAGFMMDPRLGPVGWSVPSKSEGDLGFNGWDAFLGTDIKILIADADHLSLPIPPDVIKLGSCIEEALEYLNRTK